MSISTQVTLGQSICEDSLFGYYIKRRLVILQRIFYACNFKHQPVASFPNEQVAV